MDYSIDIISVDEPQDMQISAKKAMNEIKDMIMASFHKAGSMVSYVSLFLFLSETLPVSADNCITKDSEKLENVIIADFSLSKHDGTQVYYISSVSNAVRLEAKLDEFNHLEEGWDGGFAAAPTPLALDHARKAVRAISEDILQNSAVFPSNDSGVYLQGKFPEYNARYTAFFDGKTMSYLVKGIKTLSKTKVQVNDDNLNSLEDDIRTTIGL